MTQKTYARSARGPRRRHQLHTRHTRRAAHDPHDTPVRTRVLVVGDVCREVYTRDGQTVDTRVGGSGADTAWWLARQGCHVTLVCQGRDSDRLAISDTLHRAGVSVWFQPAATTCAVTIDADTGQIGRAAGPGRAARFGLGHVPGSGFDLLHLTGSLVETAGPGPTGRLARRFAGPVSINLGPLAHDPDVADSLKGILPACRIVTANAGQAQALTGEEAPDAAAEALSNRWRTAAVTTGPGPVHIAGRGRHADATIQPNRVLDPPAAGTGSCFTAAWLAHQLAGHTPVQAARYAADHAATAVARAAPTGDTLLQ